MIIVVLIWGIIYAFQIFLYHELFNLSPLIDKEPKAQRQIGGWVVGVTIISMRSPKNRQEEKNLRMV